MIWTLTDRHHNGGLPWPIWLTVFWGIDVVMSGLGAYGDFGRSQRTPRQYERLMREQGTNNPGRYV